MDIQLDILQFKLELRGCLRELKIRFGIMGRRPWIKKIGKRQMVGRI